MRMPGQLHCSVLLQYSFPKIILYSNCIPFGVVNQRISESSLHSQSTHCRIILIFFTDFNCQFATVLRETDISLTNQLADSQLADKTTR